MPASLWRRPSHCFCHPCGGTDAYRRHQQEFSMARPSDKIVVDWRRQRLPAFNGRRGAGRQRNTSLQDGGVDILGQSLGDGG